MTARPHRIRPGLLPALALAGLLALLPARAARADVFVVVPAASPLKEISRKHLVDLYMGHTRAYPDGTFALPLDLPRDAPGREAFYRSLTGMPLAQVNSYWARLMFSGQTMPPQTLPDEAAMASLVRRNPNAIGYLLQAPSDAGLRVVLVLKTGGRP